MDPNVPINPCVHCEYRLIQKQFIDYLKVAFDWRSSDTVMTTSILGNSHNGGMGKSLASQWGNLSIMGRYFLSSVSGLNPISGLTGSDIFIPA